MQIEEYNDLARWAQEQWGKAELGDKRRNQRAIKLGQSIAAQPSASLPKQTGSWAELKAAYRLLNEAEVTHEALSQEHWQASRQKAEQEALVLFVQDTTSLDFTHHPATTDLGHIGDGEGRGFLMHSCLAILPAKTALSSPEVIGLAAQQVWTRDVIWVKTETRAQRYHRRSEGDIWAEIVETIGRAPKDSKWISVGDSASDIYSYVRRAQALDWQCILRVSKERLIETEAGQKKLKSWVKQLPPQAEHSLSLRGRDGLKKREVKLKLAWASAKVCAPTIGPERKNKPIDGFYIRCWEQSNDKEAIEWILFTTLPITQEQSAKECLQCYAQRWVIEEYHKCLKTGCAIEERQLTTAAGLSAILGFLAIAAVRLLQLRSISRNAPDRPAREVVPQNLIDTAAARLKLKSAPLTIYEFLRAVARLGGFLGRKSDGEPGWQTLWHGWQRLQDLAWQPDPHQLL